MTKQGLWWWALGRFGNRHFRQDDHRIEPQAQHTLRRRLPLTLGLILTKYTNVELYKKNPDYINCVYE